MESELLVLLPENEKEKLEQLKKYGVPLSAKITKGGIEVIIPHSRWGALASFPNFFVQPHNSRKLFAEQNKNSRKLFTKPNKNSRKAFIDKPL